MCVLSSACVNYFRIIKMSVLLVLLIYQFAESCLCDIEISVRSHLAALSK